MCLERKKLTSNYALKVIYMANKKFSILLKIAPTYIGN